jgi:hypothetical protein
MAQAFNEYHQNGIDSVVFGDLFLEEIRAYREQFLADRFQPPRVVLANVMKYTSSVG